MKEKIMVPLDARKCAPKKGGPSFNLMNRVHRALWRIVWALCASWTPVAMHGWRRMLLRLFGAKIARTSGIYPSACIWLPTNLEMEDYAYIGPRTNIYCMDKITFGPHSLASQGAHLCAGTHDVHDDNFQLKTKPIYVGANAWIAAEAFVGPGVIIGEGAVLGARGVTFRDLDPWTIYAGNPAVAKGRRRHSIGATTMQDDDNHA